MHENKLKQCFVIKVAVMKKGIKNRKEKNLKYDAQETCRWEGF